VRLLEYFEAGSRKGWRLYQFLKYAIGVYNLPQSLAKIVDSRRDPSIPTSQVLVSLLMAAVLRIPSLNQLEILLADESFQHLIGERRKPQKPGKALISADVISNVLDKLDIGTLQNTLVDLARQAERNKAFREDTFGSFRCVAIDGWEPFCSDDHHCDACLSRQVKRKTINEETGEETEEIVTQYYHRFVVAFLIAPTLDITLALEPVLPKDLRSDLSDKQSRNEGELTAAKRLIDRLHEHYGRFIDAFALDGLYPCGPIFEKLKKYNYGAVIICRKKKSDPYRFAQEVWEHRETPDLVQKAPDTNEQIEFWSLKQVDALKSFDGSVDMLKAVLTRKNGKKSTWVVALAGKAKRLRPLVALKIARGRWHIENTAFHQWVTHWNLEHRYRHKPNAITSVMHIWSLGFNLMQLFFYRRLKKPRRGRKAPDTIVGCVKLMWIDIGRLPSVVPWSYSSAANSNTC